MDLRATPRTLLASNTHEAMATEVNARSSGLRRANERPGALLDEAQAAVSASANVLRDVRERFRTTHQADVVRWQALKSEIAAKNGKSRGAVVRDEALAAASVGEDQASLARLDLALRSLENAWLFLDPSDESLV